MLIIEDVVQAAVVLKQLLELLGHEVEVAFTGLEGIAKARAMRPEVVVCGIGLPDVDGWVVAETLRAEPSLQAVPLIAFSGQSLPADVERSKRAGFDHHLAKPAPIDALDALIRELTSCDDAAP